MVAGHLQEKKGFFYMVLCWADINGKRKTKWVSTGLPIKGNKKKAEKLLMETRKAFVPDNVVPIFMRILLLKRSGSELAGNKEALLYNILRK